MLLIDAYNVLRAQWCLPQHQRGMDLRALVHAIRRSRYQNRRLRIIADGTPGPDFPPQIRLQTSQGHTWTRIGTPPAEIVWSGAHLEADDLIEEILHTTKGTAITLISSDRRLIRAAAASKAAQIGNGTFLKQLGSDLSKAAPAEPEPEFVHDVPLDPYAIAHWMHEFGYQPNAHPQPSPAPDPEPDPDPEPEPAPARTPGPQPTPENTRTRSPTANEPANPRPDQPHDFGQRLNIQLEPAQPAHTPNSEPNAEPESDPNPNQPPMPDPSGQPGSQAEHDPLDPFLEHAFAEWSQQLDPADLDMTRWMPDVIPLKRKGSRSSQPPR